MGLDMYLERRSYVQRWDHIEPAKQFAVTVTRGGKPYPNIRPERISEVTEQVGYWRKANAIHAWFVSNVQGGVDDCKEHHVPIGALSELLKAVNAVLEQPSEAETALPTQAGFFFGSTEYDEHYRYDLEETRRQISDVLAEDNENADFYYRASW